MFLLSHTEITEITEMEPRTAQRTQLVKILCILCEILNPLKVQMPCEIKINAFILFCA